MRHLFVIYVLIGVVVSQFNGLEDSYEDTLTPTQPSRETRRRGDEGRTRGSRRENRGPRASGSTPVFSQEQANCPPRCTCDKTNVTCVNVDAESSLLMQIQPLAFPELDTLIITGNRFSDISGNALFGNIKMHERLTLANLSDNRISAISQETFINMPHLEFLDLRSNRISSAARNTFGGLRNLKKLYLIDAIRGKLIKPDLLAEMFNVKSNALNQLESIDLSSNSIKDLKDSAFCGLKGLTELLLSKNSLTEFNFDKKCLRSLRRLDVSGNSITHFSATLWDDLPNLYTLDISSNPIDCGCKSKDFIVFAQKEDTRFTNQEKTLCASPQALAGQSIFRVKLESVCVPSSSNWFSNLFLVLLFGIVGFFVYHFYRNRIPTPAAFQFGYSSLNERDQASRRDDVLPEPAFL